MASNSFGQLFRITTFGESHGPAIGVVIDGCPAGLPIDKKTIDRELDRRRPGKTPYTSPRNEKDEVEILSGIFQGKTTGAPIALLIRNEDADPSKYESIKALIRPGHANQTYLQKYGLFDYRGGGRASARETAARVAAGAIAKQFLSLSKVAICAFVAELGGIAIPKRRANLATLCSHTRASPIFCPHPKTAETMMAALQVAKQEGDSLGAILECRAHLPASLGDPVYGKLEALLASAMLSLPASKGFEIDAGFAAARMKGSEHNALSSSTLGGISTGSPLTFRIAFKPTSSIQKPQPTTSLQGEPATFQLPPESRHDPCVAIRAVPIVEAMCALVLADLLLMNRLAKI